MAFSPNQSPHHVQSVDEMQSFAAIVASKLVPGDVLFLEGALGSGKTTFVQGVARALGIAEAITSPTFTLMAHYTAVHHPTIKALVHLDIWRLSDEEIKREAAIREALESPQRQEAVTIIEWADRLKGIATPLYHLQFAHGAEEHERVITYS